MHGGGTRAAGRARPERPPQGPVRRGLLRHRYEGTSALAVSLPGMLERRVILHTFSKKFAMTGWRLGPRRTQSAIIDVIVTLNVN